MTGLKVVPTPAPKKPNGGELGDWVALTLCIAALVPLIIALWRWALS